MAVSKLSPLSHATNSPVFSHRHTHYVFPHVNRYYADRGPFIKAAQISGMSSSHKKLYSGFSGVASFKNHSEENTVSEASKTSFLKFVKPEEVAKSE